jgi:hypothetical protein
VQLRQNVGWVAGQAAVPMNQHEQPRVMYSGKSMQLRSSTSMGDTLVVFTVLATCSSTPLPL